MSAPASTLPSPAPAVLNVMSVDLEDWHQLSHRRVKGGLPEITRNVYRQLDALLGLLDRHAVKATFFTMGRLAEAFPDIVQRLAGEGHEIACHGHDHLIVHTLSPEAFREDTRRCKDLLEDLTGEPVVGYRAAEFSIRRPTLWALDVLAELGFTYDSSVFPIHHRRYGIAGFEPEPRRYAFPSGRHLIEAPLATVPFRESRLPVAGGGYFRYLPGNALERATAYLNGEGLPLITYFHPYEFDPQRLRFADAFETEGWKQSLRARQFDLHQNVRRASLAGKLDRLFGAFPFGPFRAYFKQTTVMDGGLLAEAADSDAFPTSQPT